MIETILGYLLGLVVGVILGLTGGGGLLLFPAMHYLLKIPWDLSTAYTAVLVGVTATFGVIPRVKRKEIDWATVWALGLPVSFGMWLVRAWLLDWVPDELFSIGAVIVTKKMFVLTLFAGILFLSAAAMLGLFGKEIKPRTAMRKDRPVVYFVLLISCGLLIGIIPGFVGAGGGVLIVPVLVIFFGLPMQMVVGTSLAIIASKSFVGFFGGDAFRLQGEIDYPFLALFSLVMIAGVLIGSKLSVRIDGNKLKKVFAWFILVFAIFIVVKELFF